MSVTSVTGTLDLSICSPVLPLGHKQPPCSFHTIEPHIKVVCIVALEQGYTHNLRGLPSGSLSELSSGEVLGIAMKNCLHSEY